MLLEKLPIELVQQIIELVLEDDQLKSLTAILGVNKALEALSINSYLSNIRDIKSRTTYWARVAFPIRRRMACDAIMSKPDPGSKKTIATYMHAVASHLLQCSREFDGDDTGRLSHTQWLHEIASVLAPSEADCQCGKPAFLHSRCYRLSSVPDTAFHVVILRRHTKLEIAMIEQGKGVRSVCLYLKVSKKNPIFTRRNALEWACAHQFEDTARRLVLAAEMGMMKPEEYLPTAAAICAVRIDPRRCNTQLFGFLLDRLFILSWKRCSFGPTFNYQSRLVPFREWNRILMTALVQHKKMHVREATIHTLRMHYPYLEFSSNLHLLPDKLIQKRFGLSTIACQRPHCNFGPFSYGLSDEWSQHWHLVNCSAESCLNRYSKASPRCEKCRQHHVHDPEWQHTYDWDGFPKSARMRENVVGHRPQTL